jgi:hypothetical protein
MSSRLVVTVRCGTRRLSFEITDQGIEVLETPDDFAPVVAASDSVEFLLPRSPGTTFAINAELHDGGRPS